MLKLLSRRTPPPAVPAGHPGPDRAVKSHAVNCGGGRRRRRDGRKRRHKQGGHRSLWLKLRRGDLSTIQHPSRLHEQVQVHGEPQLVKVDKFLLTLGTWVGGNDVCHVRLEGAEADLLFCLRFDGRYRVRVVPFLGQVLINDEPVNSPGAMLEVGDILECGPYTFQMVPKPSASDRRGPLARPGESIVLDEGTTEAFTTAGQTIEPFIVTVPAASNDALPEQFAMVNQSIASYVETQDFAAVVLDFHQIQDWSPVLPGELIQLCEAVESRGGLCAASRLSIDFLQQFQNSGLPECFTLYPTTERAIASLT